MNRLVRRILLVTGVASALVSGSAVASAQTDTEPAQKYCGATTCSGQDCILCGYGTTGPCKFHGECQ